jgi:hypothetical protein
MLFIHIVRAPLIFRLLNQQQVARMYMYDVFGRWILSSKCYLQNVAAFIAITAFLMWPNIIL